MRRMFWSSALTLDAFHFESNNSFWPTLQELDIFLMDITPDRRWYLTGKCPSNWCTDSPIHTPDRMERETPALFDSEDSDTSDYFPPYTYERLNGDRPCKICRDRRDAATVSPFLIQIAKAVRRMPALKKLYFAFHTNVHMQYLVVHRPEILCSSRVGRQCQEICQNFGVFTPMTLSSLTERYRTMLGVPLRDQIMR